MSKAWTAEIVSVTCGEGRVGVNLSNSKSIIHAKMSLEPHEALMLAQDLIHAVDRITKELVASDPSRLRSELSH